MTCKLCRTKISMHPSCIEQSTFSIKRPFMFNNIALIAGQISG